MTENRPAGSVEHLARFLDDTVGDSRPVTLAPIMGGGSCEIWSVDRGDNRWVLRMAPAHPSSSSAHDVIREYRVLSALRDGPVPIARPIAACEDPDVFGGPFYVMERVDGSPIRSKIPSGWAGHPDTHGAALEQLIDALSLVHRVDWRTVGLAGLAPKPGREGVRTDRWLNQLGSYRGRPLPSALLLAEWLEDHRPPTQPPALCHGDYKLDNVLFAEQAPPRLLAIVDWEMVSIGDPLVDLAWALIFHPGPEGTMPLGRSGHPAFADHGLPTRDQLVARWVEATGRDVRNLRWYEVFARWKLAVVLEGSYAKFMRGESSKPVHEHFGSQVDLLLASAEKLAGAGMTSS